MCHYVVQELEPGETCKVLCRLPQHYERLLFYFCLSDGEVRAGKAAFVYGSCTFGLNRFDTVRRKYEAVKEDLESQKTEILALWQSHSQALAQPQPRPQSASQSHSSMEKLAVWKQSWRWLTERIRRLRGKPIWPGAVLESLIFSTIKGV